MTTIREFFQGLPAELMTLVETILTNDTRDASTPVVFDAEHTGPSSYQDVAADLTLDAASGKTGGSTAFLAAVMGNLMGDLLTKAGNYLGGVIGHFSVTGTKSTTYPAGAVLGGIGDGVTDADGCFVAYVDGDSAVTKAGAALKVRCNNSQAGSGFNWGIDLQDAAHDGYRAVDDAFYLKAPVRMVRDVVMLVGDAAPVDGTTGANFAGEGSLYFRTHTAAAAVYVNTGPKTATVWKAITHA
jgi:hypothetical protein